ncbi:MAG: TolC family protein [Bacteroidales bacterium]|nr:TolC family protein [Bacteroidales bacterium]
MKKILTLLILIIPVSFCFGEKKWSLYECMEYAVEHNANTNTRQLEQSIYHQDYMEAIGGLLPWINANTGTNFNFGRGVDAKTNTYVNVNSFTNDYHLSLSLMLFDGLSGYRKLQLAKVNKMLGKHTYEDVRDKIAYDTMEAFFNLLYQYDLVDLAIEELQQNNEELKKTERMEELGLKGVPDVAEIEAKYEESVFNLTQQENLLLAAILFLKDKMNYPIEEELLIVREQISSGVSKIEESPYCIYDFCKSFLPKAKSAQFAYDAQRLNYKVTKGNFAPTIRLDAGIGTNFSRFMDGTEYESFKDQIKNRRGEYVGLTLSIPLFNGFSRTSGVRKAKVRYKIAQVEKEKVFRKLYGEIEKAVTDVNGQVDEYFQAVKQRKAAEIAHQVNQRKYNEGMIDPILLHTSANRLMKAKAQELNAKYKYHLKYNLVNYYKGVPFLGE